MNIPAAVSTPVNPLNTTPDVESAREDATEAANGGGEAAENGQAGPAVVNNISTRALEASREAARADNDTQNSAAQGAQESRNANAVLTAVGDQTLQRSRVDTLV